MAPTWLPLIFLAAICVALFMPIAAWQAYVRGRSPWGWGLATLLFAGLPMFALFLAGRTYRAPPPKVAMASFWPRLGWIALFMVMSILILFASFSAFVFASGQSVHDAMRLPFHLG